MYSLGAALFFVVFAAVVWIPVLVTALATGAVVLAVGPRGLAGRLVFTAATAITATTMAQLLLWGIYGLSVGTLWRAREAVSALVAVLKHVVLFAVIGPWSYYPRTRREA